MNEFAKVCRNVAGVLIVAGAICCLVWPRAMAEDHEVAKINGKMYVPYTPAPPAPPNLTLVNRGKIPSASGVLDWQVLQDTSCGQRFLMVWWSGNEGAPSLTAYPDRSPEVEK